MKKEANSQLGEGSTKHGAGAVGEGSVEGVLATRATSMTPTQHRALENLMNGQTIGDAAKEAGIGRRTLQRWMHEDPEFQAAYNAWQKDTAEAARSSILALTEPAVRALAGALEKGDSKTALAVLKGLGLLAPPTPGSSDVEGVKKEREIEKKREGTRLFIKELEAGFPE